MKLKKYLFILTIIRFILVQPVYAATDGYDVSISSSKATYDLGETAHFEVTITKEEHPANLEAIDAIFIFPSEGQYIYPTSIVEGKIILEPVITQELESQTLTVNIYRHNRKYIIDLMKQQKESGEDTEAIKEYLKNVKWGTLWDWENPAESVSEYSDIFQQINNMVLEFEEPLATAAKTITIIIDKTPPEINVEEPDDGMATTDENITVSGTVSSDTVSVTVNGAEADLNIPYFELSGFLLEVGPNTITVKATDHAENFSEKTISVTRLEPTPVDSDGDGLTDDEELSLGTDPENWDTDKDRLGDKDEVKEYETNPLQSDTDSDGLIDGDEVFDYASSPLKQDTDEDGLNDKDEVESYLTSPINTDSDEDGLLDNEEVVTYKTDPAKKDTDNDGINDYEEIHTYSTDPLMSDTDSDGIIDGLELQNETDPTVYNEPPFEYMDVEFTEDIKNLSIVTTASTATISFTTDHFIKAELSYGKTKFYNETFKEDSFSKEHVITLSHLKPDTIYHYFFTLEKTEDPTTEGVIYLIKTYDRTFRTMPGNIAPNITIIYPENMETTTKNKTTVAGNIDNSYAKVIIYDDNDDEYPGIVKKGKFWGVNIPLISGVNRLRVKAETASQLISWAEVTVILDETSQPKITSSNLPEAPDGPLPQRIEGTWEGANARITVNGKEAVVYTDGTWVGPKIISKTEAEIYKIDPESNEYLILDTSSWQSILLEISDNGTPVNKTSGE